MATTLRNDAKYQIIKILRTQGYATYARLVDYFDIFLTDDPEVIGYMIPGAAKIVLNKDLSITQVSTIVRHEILHEYLTHGPRQQRFDKEHPELTPHLAPHDITNIAADYEISNRGYTDKDKSIIRSIKLGDRILRGLVTEDDYPDWESLTYEEMYQKLLEKDKEDRQQIQDLLDKMQGLSKKDLEDLINDAQDTSDAAQAASDAAEESGDEGEEQKQDKLEKQADQAKAAAEDAKSDLEKLEGSTSGSDQPFSSDKNQRDKADVAARVKAIKDFLDNAKEQARIQDENTGAINKEKAVRSARDVTRYQGSGLYQFKMNLNYFIQTQIDDAGDPEETYRVLNPSYEDTDLLMPGIIRKYNKTIPLINVYHDVSGSFDSPAKTAAALKAIESLNQYVRNGDIIIDVYYFADRVSDSRDTAGGGTRGAPILNHIKQTKPTNVIVITDGDISDCRDTVTVPGAVWMLFYDSRSKNLMEHLKGKRQNKYYDITY